MNHPKDPSRPSGEALPPDEVPRIGEDDAASEELRSRSSLKRERVNNENALADLVRELLALSEARLRMLGIAEDTFDALVDAKKIKSHAAKHRQSRLIRSTLRDAEWSVIRRNLDRMKAGLPLADAESANSLVIHWTQQLLVQGDEGLARFLDSFPDADRKRLRMLIRNVHAASEQKRAKARGSLEQAIAQEMGRA